MTDTASSAATARPAPQPRSAYRAFRSISTRWADNDVYGHVNNVVYYSWFDTAVNAHLIEQGVLDIHAGTTIGLVIETQCNYFAPLAFPQTVEAGIRVARLGAPACATRWGCSPKASRSALRPGTSSTCMWTAQRAARCRCPKRCARCCRHCRWLADPGRPSIGANPGRTCSAARRPMAYTLRLCCP